MLPVRTYRIKKPRVSREETEEKVSFPPDNTRAVRTPQMPQPGGLRRNERFHVSLSNAPQPPRTCRRAQCTPRVAAVFNLVHRKQLLSHQLKFTIKERSGATAGKQGRRGEKVTEEPEERLACSVPRHKSAPKTTCKEIFFLKKRTGHMFE